MNMNGMYHEDENNKKVLEATANRDRFKDEADVVLKGDADSANKNYAVIKPEDGYKGVTNVDNPFEFAHKNDDVKVLVIHGDGSFNRFNFAINARVNSVEVPDEPSEDDTNEDNE